MYIYEKDNKLNFEFDNHNQVPTTPDLVLSKDGLNSPAASDDNAQDT